MEALLIAVAYLLMVFGLMGGDSNDTLIGTLLMTFGVAGFTISLGYNLLEFFYNIGVKKFAPIVTGVGLTKKNTSMVEKLTLEIDDNI